VSDTALHPLAAPQSTDRSRHIPSGVNRHRHDGHVIIGGIWAQRGNPEAATEAFAAVLKQYRLREAVGDRYAADWTVQAFKRHGVTLSHSEKNRSELYIETLPLMSTGGIELPPDERTIAQFAALEPRASRIGRDVVDHGPNGHDDRSNVCAGVATLLARKSTYTLDNVFDETTDRWPSPLAGYL